MLRPVADDWLGTKEASERMGITLRTLYRLIDEGQIAAYKFGRVIRLQRPDVEAFIESVRIAPGSLEHLYPDTHPKPAKKSR
jgi:excisionase family DNA binding protein